MIYLLALIPATGLTVAGYFVLYLSQRSEGNLRAFGKYLGFWAFTLAALVILAAIFAAAHGGRHRAMMRVREPAGMMYPRPWQGGPRFFMPRRGGPPEGGQLGGVQPGGPVEGAARAPAGAAQSATPNPAPAPQR